jgi:hypothetical protein
VHVIKLVLLYYILILGNENEEKWIMNLIANQWNIRRSLHISSTALRSLLHCPEMSARYHPRCCGWVHFASSLQLFRLMTSIFLDVFFFSVWSNSETALNGRSLVFFSFLGWGETESTSHVGH